MAQLTLFGKETKVCPKCKKGIMTWKVLKEIYGFCDNCVEGFYF